MWQRRFNAHACFSESWIRKSNFENPNSNSNIIRSSKIRTSFNIPNIISPSSPQNATKTRHHWIQHITFTVETNAALWHAVMAEHSVVQLQQGGQTDRHTHTCTETPTTTIPSPLLVSCQFVENNLIYTLQTLQSCFQTSRSHSNCTENNTEQVTHTDIPRGSCG